MCIRDSCRTIQIGARATNQYDTLICYGVATFILVEASFNIGAVCGLLPITGVTLPFISYGGSSMLAVSYTHLDVYKRQKWSRLRRRLLFEALVRLTTAASKPIPKLFKK